MSRNAAGDTGVNDIRACGETKVILAIGVDGRGTIAGLGPLRAGELKESRGGDFSCIKRAVRREPEPKRVAMACAKGSKDSVGGGSEFELPTFEKKSIEVEGIDDGENNGGRTRTVSKSKVHLLSRANGIGVIARGLSPSTMTSNHQSPDSTSAFPSAFAPNPVIRFTFHHNPFLPAVRGHRHAEHHGIMLQRCLTFAQMPPI